MTNKRWMIAGMAIGLLVLLSIVALAQPVAPLGIIVQPPDPAGLSVRIWLDRGVYAVNENVQVHFEVNEDAYIYIWSINAHGEIVRIFPNDFSGHNHVRAGQHTIPDSPAYQLIVSEPVGTAHLQIVASKQPLEIGVHRPGPFPLLSVDPAAFKIHLQVQILGIIPEPLWAVDWTSYEVVVGTPPPHGALTITSTPSGAWITINGSFVGITPRTIHLRQGFHQIGLSKSGYRDWSRNFFIIGGRTRTIRAMLAPLAPVNQPPVAAFTFSPPSPEVNEWIH
ncbi:DUF4384 domain-containing protein, partial [Candidatus Bipolaricaulota bacterium]|nr:DUF4384 domain-containing protein [Candidatus Bipolaricaulota bacterium]